MTARSMYRTYNKNALMEKKATDLRQPILTEQQKDSYIFCRLTYDMINRAIAHFNRTICSKYKLIANYSTKYNDEQIKRYINFKEQENNEIKGQFS
jgi:hypothetical protein